MSPWGPVVPSVARLGTIACWHANHMTPGLRSLRTFSEQYMNLSICTEPPAAHRHRPPEGVGFAEGDGQGKGVL